MSTREQRTFDYGRGQGPGLSCDCSRIRWYTHFFRISYINRLLYEILGVSSWNFWGYFFLKNDTNTGGRKRIEVSEAWEGDTGRLSPPEGRGERGSDVLFVLDSNCVWSPCHSR